MDVVAFEPKIVQQVVASRARRMVEFGGKRLMLWQPVAVLH